jgi:hypothetical protein
MMTPPHETRPAGAVWLRELLAGRVGRKLADEMLTTVEMLRREGKGRG